MLSCVIVHSVICQDVIECVLNVIECVTFSS